MSERYITDRYLPDKAIDLIDEACSNVNLHNKTLARLSEVDKELADLAKEREVMMAAATEEAYQRLAQIKSLELRLQDEQKQLQADSQRVLTEENLANVVELWTNIPASRIQEQEFQRLAKLEDRLKTHIVARTRRSAPWPPPSAGAGRASAPSTSRCLYVYLLAAGRRPVRHPRGPDPAGHVRVHGEARRLPDHRLPAGLHRL